MNNQNTSETKTLVMKFGGTSVGSVDALNQAAGIVQAQAECWDNLVVVVSAMSGVTNTLLQCAQAVALGDQDGYTRLIDELHAQHLQTVQGLIAAPEAEEALAGVVDDLIHELDIICSSAYVLGEVTPRGVDAICSFGERINARVFSGLLRQKGLPSQSMDATRLIVTDSNFQNAHPIVDATRIKVRQNLAPILAQGKVVVVTGFIAANEQGVTLTLGRGGSDYTAAILGDALDADEVWTWTDVDGVLSADPRIVPNARVIPEISFNEVGEMAYFGAKVLHPKTIRPIVERDIPLWVKNTFNPAHPGTRISQDPPANPGKITAITAIRDLSLITVAGRGMLGVPGIAARTFAAVAQQDTSVLMISQSSSEQSICFIIPTANAKAVIESLEEEMALELFRKDIDRVWAVDDMVVLSVIGAGMRDTPGVSARIFGALGRAGINVVAIAQGSSEYSISMAVAAEDADRAVQQIHHDVIELEKEANHE
jgi:aspartate kinase